MNKTVGTVAGIVIVVGLAWTGASWYTGTQVEKELRTSVDKANAKLHTFLPNAGITLALADFQKGLFSSTAHYSLVFPVKAVDGVPAHQGEIRMVNHIEHGPFPLSRAKTLNLTPVMATDHFALEKNATTADWFAATKDVAPVSGMVSLGYSGNARGWVKAEPVNVTEHGTSIVLSGTTMNLDLTDNGTAGKVDGAIDSFIVSGAPQQGVTAKVDMQNLQLNSDMKSTFVGTNVLTINKLLITSSDSPAVTISNYAQHVKLDEANNKVSGSVIYELGMVNVGGKDVAGGQIALSAKNLDTAALTTLRDVYGQVAMREMNRAQGAAVAPDAASQAEQQQFQSALDTLLAGNPTVTIDPVIVKTPRGESHFSLSVDLAKPSAPKMSIESIVGEVIKKLDASLTLNKPMVADLLAQSGERRGLTGGAALQAASQQVDMLSNLAVGSGLGTLQGENIVSKLSYQGGQIDLNGKKMPVDRFAGLVFGLALGGGNMGGMPPGGDIQPGAPAMPQGIPPSGTQP